MAWTTEQTEQVIGYINPAPNIGYTGPISTNPGAGWLPARPPEDPSDDALDGVRLVSEYLELGAANPLITAGLKLLEEQLKERLRDNEARFGLTLLATPVANPTYDNYRAALPPIDDKADARRPLILHLLRDTLLEQLLLAGFELADPAEYVPTGILPADKFYKPMLQGSHVKDVLVGLEHGEWTHMLQWYLLSVSRPTAPGFTFVPAQVFQYLAQQGIAQDTADASIGPLWQFCCDRVAVTYPTPNVRGTDLSDYRTPDHLHVDLAGIAGTRLKSIRAHYQATYPNAVGTIDLWAQRCIRSRTKWPLLCALLERRLRSREWLYCQAIRAQNRFLEMLAIRLETELRLWSAAPKIDFTHPETNLREYLRVDDKVKPEHHALLAPNSYYLKLHNTFTPAEITEIKDILNSIWKPELAYLQEKSVRALLYVWSKAGREGVAPAWALRGAAIPADTWTSSTPPMDPKVQTALLTASKQGFWDANKLQAELASP